MNATDAPDVTVVVGGLGKMAGQMTPQEAAQVYCGDEPLGLVELDRFPLAITFTIADRPAWHRCEYSQSERGYLVWELAP